MAHSPIVACSRVGPTWAQGAIIGQTLAVALQDPGVYPTVRSFAGHTTHLIEQMLLLFAEDT